MIEINDNDVVLNPISGLRGKRAHNLPKGDLVAFVWLNDDAFGDWSHPELSLRVVRECKDGQSSTWTDETELITIKYQRNRMNRPTPSPHDRPAKGFLAGKVRGGEHFASVWCQSYGGKVEGQLGYYGEIRSIQAGLDLIDRANEAVSWRNNEKLAKALGKVGDSLLTLIAGLQRIGVKVVIRKGKLCKKHPAIDTNALPSYEQVVTHNENLSNA